MNRNNNLFLAILVGVLTLIVGETIHLEKKLSSQKQMTKRKLRKLRKLRNYAGSVITSHTKNSEVPFSLPNELLQVPLAENQFIIGVKNLNIEEPFAPYNPSIIEKEEGGYYLFFRYDVVRQMHANHFHSHIGLVELDRNFEQVKPFSKIDTKSSFSEDPRVLKANGKLFLSYNDLLPDQFYSRTIRLAEIDLKANKAVSIQNLDLGLQQIEKNWTPFVYQDENHQDQIHFEYQLLGPRKVLKLDRELQWLDFVEQSIATIGYWDKKWGTPRGGTPPRLIDGEYLGFFHSSFVDQRGIYWYTMGAYTFEATPPFRVTRISSHPILFRGIYDSEALNTAGLNKFVIFPAGFALENVGGKTHIHLSCGENDGAIKLITMDKEMLLKSLKKIDL